MRFTKRLYSIEKERKHLPITNDPFYLAKCLVSSHIVDNIERIAAFKALGRYRVTKSKGFIPLCARLKEGSKR